MSERVRIGIVGLNFGRHVVEQICRGDGASTFELAAVCDSNRQRAEALAAATGVPAHFSIDSLLSDPTIPVVGLFTGPNGRASLIRQIIATGRDVMTTKPFEADAQAAAQILEEAKAMGRVVHLNSPSPSPTDDLLQIGRWRETMNLGKPVAARAEVWASYREASDGSWYDSPEACPVAPIYRLGIYLINDLIHLLGEPESVSVLQSRLFTGRPTPDNAQLGIRFRSGALANVFASFCVADAQHYRNTLTLNYERGTVYRNTGPAHEEERHGPAALAVVTAGPGGKPTTRRAKVLSSSGSYQWQAFHDAIARRSTHTPAMASQVVTGIRVIEAMARAQCSGRSEPVSI